MNKEIVDEIFHFRNLGYEVEIRRKGKTVSVGYGSNKNEALADAIKNKKHDLNLS